MAYLTYNEYVEFGYRLDEDVFNEFVKGAERIIDLATNDFYKVHDILVDVGATMKNGLCTEAYNLLGRYGLLYRGVHRWYLELIEDYVIKVSL